MSFSHGHAWFTAVASSLALSVLVYACTQGEGQPCIPSVDNNPNDNQCASPFQCVVPANCSTAACCVEDDAGNITSTLATCLPCPEIDAASEAGADGEAGVGDAGDAGMDAGMDASDGATDAPIADSSEAG